MKAFDRLDRAVEVAIALLFALMLVAGILQITNRFFFNISISWSEELQRYLNIWITFLAIPVGYRRGTHIGMNMLVDALPRAPQRLLLLLQEILWLVLALAIGYYATEIMAVAKNQSSSSLGVTMDKVYVAQVIGGAYLALIALRRLVTRLSPCKLIALEPATHAPVDEVT